MRINKSSVAWITLALAVLGYASCKYVEYLPESRLQPDQKVALEKCRKNLEYIQRAEKNGESYDPFVFLREMELSMEGNGLSYAMLGMGQEQLHELTNSERNVRAYAICRELVERCVAATSSHEPFQPVYYNWIEPHLWIQDPVFLRHFNDTAINNAVEKKIAQATHYLTQEARRQDWPACEEEIKKLKKFLYLRKNPNKGDSFKG